jgi:hypothetical protein
VIPISALGSLFRTQSGLVNVPTGTIGKILDANPNRWAVYFSNRTANDVQIKPAPTDANNAGWLIRAGRDERFIFSTDGPLAQAEWHGITAPASQIFVMEVIQTSGAPVTE